MTEIPKVYYKTHLLSSLLYAPYPLLQKSTKSCFPSMQIRSIYMLTWSFPVTGMLIINKMTMPKSFIVPDFIFRLISHRRMVPPIANGDRIYPSTPKWRQNLPIHTLHPISAWGHRFPSKEQRYYVFLTCLILNKRSSLWVGHVLRGWDPGSCKHNLSTSLAGKAMVTKQGVVSHSPSWPPLLHPPPAIGPHAILSSKSYQLLILNSLLLENVRNFVRRNKDGIV